MKVVNINKGPLSLYSTNLGCERTGIKESPHVEGIARGSRAVCLCVADESVHGTH